MARSKATFDKREKEKQRLKKREDKQIKKDERKANSGTASFESMIAYVDENGQLTSTPPDPSKRKEIDAESIELGVPKKVAEEIPAERIGRVDFFDSSKGFGFIKEASTQERFFVHVSGLMEEIGENDKVSFEVERGMKGMNAVRVKKAV